MGIQTKLLAGLICFSVAGYYPLQAQFKNTDGFPFIRNYTAEEYEGHIQNWGFAQNSKGIIYISNIAGVIQYDGVNWHHIEVPNGRTFSIQETPDDRIYVGGVNEFGYLETSKANPAIPQYKSLKSLIPDSIDFGHIWTIEYNEEKVYFYSTRHLFQYDGKEITIYNTESRFRELYKFGSNILIRESQKGIQKIVNNEFIPSFESHFFSGKILRGMVPLGNKNLYCTNIECFVEENEEFVKFKTGAAEYLKENTIDEFIKLSNGTILLATRKGGIVNIAPDGQLIHIINEETGLISNVVYGLYEDNNGFVWVATVNGLSKIEYSLPFRIFDERNGISSLIKRIEIADDKIFAASRTGFYISDSNSVFQELSTGNSCTSLLKLKEFIYGDCTGALYQIKNNVPQKIPLEVSAGEAEIYSNTNNTIIFGNEASIYLAELTKDKITILYQLDDIRSRPNSIEVDVEKNVWIGTDAHGLYKIRFVQENGKIVSHTTTNYLTAFENESGDKRVFTTLLGGEPVFLTWGKGIQRFNAEADSLELVAKYGEIFTEPARQIFWAEEDHIGNVWFRSDQKYQGALLQEDGSYKIYEGVLNRINDGQSNTIYPDLFGNIWFSIKESLIRYDVDLDFDYSKPYHTQINKVLVRNDSIINAPDNPGKNILKYKDNELRFTYAAASYDEPEKTQYRVKLAGFDESWTPWTSEAQKDYTNIPEGNYNFIVQAKNVYGTLSTSEPFNFVILAPWYRTWWAYILYTLAIAGIFYIVHQIRLNQILKVYRIRNNIASDLHDEVSATLSSISYFAQAIKSDSMKGDKNRFISLIADSAGDAKEKISDIVWAINPEHDDWSAFLSKCRRYASDLLESKDMKYSLKIAEDIPGNLDMQLRQHLWLIYKEMITNVARHSDAGNLDVILSYENGTLKLVVQDDGVGMDIDKVKKGNGLVNIHKRVEQIKGTVALKSDKGFGTRWSLNVPL